MINFRYHIVSLTAVFLALGIGLMLGTTFLDTATVDSLRERQEELEGQISDARGQNRDQADRIESFEAESAAFDEQVGERLFPGLLTGVPVLVISTRGVDEAQVERIADSLAQADADLVGTWWLSDRLLLDGEDEVTDLADALELSTDDVDRLRSTLAGVLGDVLFAASDSSPADEAPDSGEGTEDTTPDGTGPQGLVGAPAQGEGGEPPAVARLREAGFVEYEMPEGADGDVVALPASGLRLVIVSGPEASVPPGQMVVPMLIEYSFGGVVPAVAVEPSVVAADGEGDDESPPESLVIDVREDSDLVERMSTVDDLERVPGLVATVLAVADADPAAPRIGHYGLGDGTRLLPPPPEADE
jgi:hypothetical protein